MLTFTFSTVTPQLIIFNLSLIPVLYFPSAQSKVLYMTKELENTEMPADIAKLSFEAAMAELETLVRSLEDGKAKLEDAIVAYERGAFLKRHCQAKLRDAQVRIEQITLGDDGAATAPFNV